MVKLRLIYDMAQFGIDHSALDEVLAEVQQDAMVGTITAEDIRNELDYIERELGYSLYSVDHVLVRGCLGDRNVPEGTVFDAIYIDGSWRIIRIYRSTDTGSEVLTFDGCLWLI